MGKIHKFRKSLEVGSIGEKIIAEHFPDLIHLDGRKGDFQAQDGTKIELKTDMYDMNATTNFFIERYSSMEKGSNGGPWQAEEHECKEFWYFYLPNKTVFCFKLETLIPALNIIIRPLKPVQIANHKWTTIGYKVPRELVKHLYTKIELK